MSKAHHPFEEWMVDALLALMENSHILSDWELSFVKDRAGAYDKYGWNAVITDKQIEILKKLDKKVRFKTKFKEISENDNSPW